jgi:hypothetical protein
MTARQQVLAVLMLVLMAGVSVLASPTPTPSPAAAGGVVREFSVLSRPMKLKYGEVHNTVQDPVRLPEDVVQEFAENPIAIVDYQVDIVSFDDEGNEVQVPLYDGYNHHYLMILGRYNTMKSLYDKHKSDPYGGYGLNTTSSMMSMQQLKRSMMDFGGDDGSGKSERAANFGGGSGAEERGTSHRLPRPYAHIVDSPESLMPLIHLINTKDNATRGEGYSPLLECPCTPQRVFDVKDDLVDGRPPIPPFSCNLNFESQQNPSCSIQIYESGFRCCEHGVFVIDTDQYDVDALPVTNFYFKFNFKYEKVVSSPQEEGVRSLVTLPVRPPACCDVTANLTVGGNIEFDVPLCTAGTAPEDCIFEMASTQFFDLQSNYHSKAAQHPEEENPDQLVGLVYAVGHLHVGGLSLDLYNDETGELICHSDPTYGTGEEPGNEKDYLVGMSDCVFDPPLYMKRSQLLRTVSRYNSTINHRGVMALWLMEVTDEATTTTTLPTLESAF